MMSKYSRCSDYQLRKECGKGRGPGCFEVISRHFRGRSKNQKYMHCLRMACFLTGFELCTNTKLAELARGAVACEKTQSEKTQN